MQLRKITTLITLSILLAVWLRTALPATAQRQDAPKPPLTPLFIGANNGQSLVEGDTWSWDGSRLIKRTINGHNYLPVVSPTGGWFAYQQVSPAFVKQRAANDTLQNQEVPTDIYLFDLKTGNPTRIAGQPTKPVFITNGQASYVIRSEPSWSPDGKQLTWTEIVVDPTTNSDLQKEQLVVYDLAAKTTRILVNPLPAHRFTSQYYPHYSQVSFGPDGLIGVLVYTSEDVDPNDSDALFVYDLAGKQVAEVDQVTQQDSFYDQGQLIWMSGEGHPFLSCVSCTTRVDPLNGDLLPLPGTPEMYSPLAPDKLSLHYGADSGDESNVTWIIALNDQQISKFDSVRIANVTDAAISPDGMQVAAANFAGQGTTAGVFIYRAQTKRTISIQINVTGMGWGPVAWRLYPDPTQYF